MQRRRVIGPRERAVEPGVEHRQRALAIQRVLRGAHLVVLGNADLARSVAPACASTSTAAMTRSATSASASSKPSSRMPIRSPAIPSASPLEHVHVLRHVARLARIVRVVAGGRLERGRRVLDRARHRPGVVDALVGAEPDPEMGHQAERRLEPERAAERGRNTDRAALVAAERDVHLAGGHRGARA